MHRFLLILLLVSVIAAFASKFIAGVPWTETMIAETIGAAFGLVFYSSLGALAVFYTFLYWGFKRFDLASFRKIAWAIWGLFAISAIAAPLLGVN